MEFVLRGTVQRLFSTFASEWPGKGLLLLRVLTAAVLIHCAVLHLKGVHHLVPAILQGIAAVLLLIGLGTPLVGTSVVAVEVWILFSGSPDPWIAILASGLGATLAMVGPGAWSVDARLFGRKRIEIRKI